MRWPTGPPPAWRARLWLRPTPGISTGTASTREACTVLGGPGPLALTYERGVGAGSAPAFKVLGWKGPAPGRVEVDGKEMPARSAVVDGTLLLQVLGRIESQKASVKIGDGTAKSR